MKYSKLIFLFLFFLPLACFAGANDRGFHTYAPVISFTNVVLEITSLICIKQFFFLGDYNRTNFQRFNLIFGIVFFIIAISFLIEEREFYTGFEQLSASQSISKFFFGMGIYSALQWLVIFGLVINVLYIRKYADA